MALKIVFIATAGGISPVRAPHGNVEIAHPLPKGNGAIGGSGDRTAVDGRQCRGQDGLGFRLSHLGRMADDAAAMVSFGFAGRSIGEVDVVVDFPAAVFRSDDFSR